MPSRSESSDRNRPVSSEVPVLMTRSGAQRRRSNTTAANTSQGLLAMR